MKLPRIHLLVVATILLAAACKPGSDRRAWDEETRLADGRIIIVHQERRYERVYTGEGTGDMAREAWLTLTLPEIQPTEISWHENLFAMIVNVDGGSLYVVGRPFTAREARQYGEPSPPYICFRYVNGKWIRIALTDLPSSIYETNMWMKYLPPEGQKAISLEDKQKLFDTPGFRSWQKRVDLNHRP